MWPFRRRRRSAELGAAVTGIPGMPTARLVPASYGAFALPQAAAEVAAPAAVVASPVAVVQAPDAASAPPTPVAPPAPVAVAAPEAVAVPAAPVPRVELGFRDGSTAALAPGSPQALALTEIASVLTKRD